MKEPELRRCAATLATALLLTGCGGWERASVGDLERVKPAAVVELWRGRQRMEWHAIRVTADSISGIPYFKRIDCDSCRMAIARAEVDSVRQGGNTSGGVLAPIVIGAVVLLFLLRLELGHLSAD